ncbi:YchJ family metal-binding protein [Alteromonas sp.]|jgi:SEC-C motif-containing protein|uniref:YchJ family protein n=2 Tax=Alteromonas sp. TaxID=232 RepID=UPI0032D9528E
MSVMRCYCCSSASFERCCEPFLNGTELPKSAEQLMRSRFSAYATNQYEYVLNTYTREKQKGLTVENLKQSADGALWFALQITPPSAQEATSDTVEFTAFYYESKSLFQLHETSNFLIEDNQWRYHDGTLHDDCGKIKYGRNLPCLCGSNKKFKQCCATKLR